MFNALIIAFYATISAGGLALIKYNAIASVLGIMGITLYGAGFAIWIGYIVKSLPLSVAFPLASGSVAVALFLLDYFVEGRFSI